MDIKNLKDLSRKDLQSLAKSHGLKANKKSSTLIEELLELIAVEKNPQFPSPLIEEPSTGKINCYVFSDHPWHLT